MRRKMALRIVALLALCLLAGGILAGASTAGPPPGPPPPPPPPPPAPEPTPPPPEVYPCALVPIPPEIDDLLRNTIPPPPPELMAGISDAIIYTSQYFKTYINLEWSGTQALFNFAQLQRGAFIGGMKALVKFQIIDRGQCFPTLAAARSLDDGDFLLWMADGRVILGMTPRNRIPSVGGRTIELNWFMTLVAIKDPPELIAIIFYPDAKYRSPEEMLKAARSLDDGGILAPLPPETATD